MIARLPLWPAVVYGHCENPGQQIYGHQVTQFVAVGASVQIDRDQVDRLRTGLERLIGLSGHGGQIEDHEFVDDIGTPTIPAVRSLI